jgi:hypothetical protein
MTQSFVVVVCAVFVQLIKTIRGQLNIFGHIPHTLRDKFATQLHLLRDDSFQFLEETLAVLVRLLL